MLTMAGFTLLGTAVRERLIRRGALFRIGAAIASAGMWGWCRLVRTHKPALLLVGDIIVLGVGLGLMHGAMDALVVEPFPTPIAYTGIAVLYQVTNALIHIIYPSLAFWLLSLGESSSLHALRIAPGVNAIGLVVTSLLLGGVVIVCVEFLRAYQRLYVLLDLISIFHSRMAVLTRPSSIPVTRTHRSSLPQRGLRIRECIELANNPPSERSTALHHSSV